MKTKRIFALIVALMLIFTTFTYATENTNISTSEVEEEDTQTGIMPRTSVEIGDDTNSDEIGDEYGISLLEDDEDYTETTSDDYVYGDFYGADSVVDITTDVSGNVFAMGQTVNISNVYISGDIFVLAQELNITNSIVTGSIFTATNAFKISNTSALDIYALAQSATFNTATYIYRDVKIAASEVNLAGSITRNAYITTDALNIENDTEILGKLSYSATEEAEIPIGTAISQVDFTQKSTEKEDVQNDFDAMSVLMNALTFIIKVAIISGFLLAYSTNFKKVNDNSESEGSAKKIAKFAGNGFLVLILVPIIAVVLLFTIVGLGLGVALLGIYAILLYCAMAIASLSIAMLILKNKENSKSKIWGLSLVIALAIWVVGKIPYIGAICKFIVMLIGLGSLKATIFYRNKDNKKEEVSGLAKELNKENSSENSNKDDSEN